MNDSDCINHTNQGNDTLGSKSTTEYYWIDVFGQRAKCPGEVYSTSDDVKKHSLKIIALSLAGP